MNDDWRLEEEAEENRLEQARWALEGEATALLEAAEATERPQRRRPGRAKHGVEIVRSADRCRVSKTFRSDIASDIVDAEWSGAIFEGGRIESKR